MKATTLPAQHFDLFEKQAFAQIVTVMPDGTPR
jgi:hypothetical protein